MKPGSIFVSIKGPDQAQRIIFMISGSVRLPYVVRGRLTAIPMEGADFLLLSFGIRRIIVRNSSKSILPGSGTCSAQPRTGNFSGSQPPNPEPQTLRFRPSPLRSTSFMMASTSCFVYLACQSMSYLVDDSLKFGA